MRMLSRLQHGDRTLLRLRGAALKIRTISPNTALALLTAGFPSVDADRTNAQCVC
jgi:hypothetical protein